MRLELCQLKAKSVMNFVTEAEFVKEVADAIEKLNDRPDSFARCREALRGYHETPGEPARVALQEAYEAVPARHGRENEAIEAMGADIDRTLAVHGRRPAIVLRMSHALHSIAEYLDASGEEAAAMAALWKSLRLDPDSPAQFQIAKSAVSQDDRALARRLTETLAELGAPALTAQPLASAFGLDVSAFQRLLE